MTSTQIFWTEVHGLVIPLFTLIFEGYVIMVVVFLLSLHLFDRVKDHQYEKTHIPNFDINTNSDDMSLEFQRDTEETNTKTDPGSLIESTVKPATKIIIATDTSNPN